MRTKTHSITQTCFYIVWKSARKLTVQIYLVGCQFKVENRCVLFRSMSVNKKVSFKSLKNSVLLRLSPAFLNDYTKILSKIYLDGSVASHTAVDWVWNVMSTTLILCLKPFLKHAQTLKESSIITHRNRTTERAVENVPSITSMLWAGQLAVATFHYKTPSSLYNSAL